jgi:hypothetical protein
VPTGVSSAISIQRELAAPPHRINNRTGRFDSPELSGLT